MADDESKPTEGDVKEMKMDVDDQGDNIKSTPAKDLKGSLPKESPQKESLPKESPLKESPKKESPLNESPKKESKDSPQDVKQTPKKETKESPKKESKKDKDSDEEADDDKEEDDDEDDDDESEEELPPGLLEQPLEVSGKREKKKVDRLAVSMPPPQSTEKKKVEIEEGTGTKLGEIPYVEHMLNVTKVIDLKPLHRLLFHKLGTNFEIKRNLRQFCGFKHKEKEGKDYEKRVAALNKINANELKSTCTVLGLERGGTKKDIIDRLMDFFIEPHDTGAKIPVKKSKSAKKGTKRKRKTKAKKTEKKAGKKKKKQKEESPDEDEEEEEEDGDVGSEEEEEEPEEEEEEEEADESESEDEEPKKKKAKTEPKKKAETKKKTPPKKVAKQNGKKEKNPKKEAKTKKSISSDDDLSDDSDDEPIAAMKKSPPSNDEIKDLVKKILDGADLETVTMKTVVKQVYAKYPTFDLSDRKDFIKNTVREVIS